jgi:hypothetical protein
MKERPGDANLTISRGRDRSVLQLWPVRGLTRGDSTFDWTRRRHGISVQIYSLSEVPGNIMIPSYEKWEYVVMRTGIRFRLQQHIQALLLR